MPLIQWIMQNLQPRAQDSALVGGNATVSLEYQFPGIGENGGAILGAETADFTSKRTLRKLIRFLPGEIAYDICSNQKWTIISYYFDLNGFVKYVAYNNIKQMEFYEDELQIGRPSVARSYQRAKDKSEYLQSLSAFENSFVQLSLDPSLAIFKFTPGDFVFDIYDGKKWNVLNYYIDLNSFTRYKVSDGNVELEFLEEELQLTKPKIKQNCDLTETEDEYSKAQKHIDYLESTYSESSLSLSSEPNLTVFKFLPGEIVFDVYKKQKWQILDSFADLNGSTVYTVWNKIVKKKYLEEELQSEKLAMKQLYEEAEQKINYLQGPAMLNKRGAKK